MTALKEKVSYIIAARPQARDPIGTVILSPNLPKGYLPLVGQHVSIVQYPGLYAVIGDQYCPQRVQSEAPQHPVIRWLRSEARRFGIKYRPRMIEIENPKFKPGFFRLPDLRFRMKIPK